MEFQVNPRAEEVTIEAVIIRADGTREDRGVVSYWHRNRFRRLAWNIRRKLRRDR
jgi:hypothetical protein